MRGRIDRINTMSIVHLLGFSMLCGFPEQTYHLLINRLHQWVRRVSFSALVRCLLGWIDYYGTSTGMRERFIGFITSEVPGDQIRISTLFYLRIACVLRDSSFFSWILDKNPFFSNDVWLGMSSLDARLGLSPWTSVFERRLNFFGSLLRNMQYLPGRVSPASRGAAPADERETVLTSWRAWLLSHAASNQAQFENINPSILVLHSVAVSQDVELSYNHTVGISALTNAVQWLRRALLLAKVEIAQHITVDDSEPFGFRINHHDTFPWDYRVDEDTDQTLFSMIATSNLFVVEEDLARN